MRFYFEEAAQWEAHVKDTLEEINRLGLPLVLFGRPKCTDPAFLQSIRVPVQYICCNTAAAWGGKFWGLDVISPEELQKIYRDYAILALVTGKQREVLQQISQFAVPPSKIFQLDLHWCVWDHHMPRDSAAYFQEVQSMAERIYDRLADQKSKDTYEAVIRYHMNRENDILAPIVVPNARQYFPESLGENSFLGSEEIFVDAGAYTGDTVQDFVSAVQGQYRHIYAIEPEYHNFQALKNNTKALQNVTCLKHGLGESAQKLYIASAGSASQLVEDTGAESISIDTLDHLLGGVPVTYIKMDIEGMECPALRGAKGLIQKYHPKLAICCYHSDADLIGVPREILKLSPDYRLFIRHYAYNLAETVCYAI